MQAKTSQKLSLAGMLLAMLLWGGSWVSAKMLSGQTSADTLVFWRFFLSFISFFPMMFILKKPFKISGKAFAIILAGSVFMAVYNQLFFRGLLEGLAGAGGVMVTSLAPIFTFLLTAVLFKERMNGKELLGLLLGIIGGGILLQMWKFDVNQIFLKGNLYFLLAALTWGGVTICSNKGAKVTNTVTYSFYLYLFSSIIDYIIASVSGSVWGVFSLGSNFWWNILYISVFATSFSTTAFFMASGKLGSNKASAFIFVVPLCAMLLSWVFLGEQPLWYTLAGGTLSIAAVYLINSGKKEEKEEPVLEKF